ncbi:MAG: DsbA family protein [Mesorhizobium sp.]|nr:DsbA family protein [Mesorhizobium sp.]
MHSSPTFRRTASGQVHTTISRRSLLAGLGTFGLLAAMALRSGPALASDPETELLFNDPEVPIGGNPNGGLTIVSFFDYNCPFCRRSSGPLEEVVQEDGDIRLIYKDWPILSEASVTGAVLALAAHRQGRYEQAYNALMSLEGRADDEAMRRAVAAADLDLTRLESDMTGSREEINGLLGRNMEQADGIGLRGTPAYIVGPFLVTAALNLEWFRQVVADARDRMNG